MVKQIGNINPDNSESFPNSEKNTLDYDLISDDVLNILGSRFSKLNNKILINKFGEKRICKFIDSKINLKKINLEDENGKIIAYIKFEYKGGYFSIDSLISYERGNGALLLDFFLKNIKGKGVFLTDTATLRDSDNGKGEDYILDGFYNKRGFKIPDSKLLQKYDVLIKGNISEGKILYKFF